MKGLLLKDFYTIKSSIISLLITFMVIGFGISFFVVPQVLIIIATIVLGMSVTTIFNIDKKSITFPTKKSSIISCKYLMYSFVSIIGVFFGIGFSTAISLIIKDTNFNFLPTFIYLSVIMTFFSGSILLPCFYLLDEEKSMIGAMVSYPLGAGFVFVMTKLIGNNILSMTISTVLSLILFIVSWYFLSKYVEKNDIQ
jgi:ABC-2 type transport system permease protein